MRKKTRAFDWRAKYTCFVCDKELKKINKKFLIALDGWHKPINLYIHRNCYDKKKIEAKIKKTNFGDGVWVDR